MSVILVIPPVCTDIYPGIYNNNNNKKHMGKLEEFYEFFCFIEKEHTNKVLHTFSQSLKM